jgi:hypothetical protein
MAAWIETYRAASGTAGRYPGERAADTEVLRGRTGVPLPESVVTELRKVGTIVGRPFDLTPKSATERL